MAIGGSTNAIIHLIAMAGRAGIRLPLEKFDEISHRTPVLANLRPSGQYLMEDFYDAGGLPALLRNIRHLLHLDCRTVNGRTLGENIADAKVFNDQVILSPDKPLSQAGATFVLRGNLAPDGCVIKPTCAEPRLLKHTGPAGTFTTTHTWPKGSAYPDSFIIGDPHLNYYEGSAHVDDIRLYVPADDTR